MVRRTEAKAGEETDNQISRRQTSERGLADAAHAFAQILRLSWRGGTTRLASYFETAEADQPCEKEEGGEEEDSAGGPSPDGETNCDREVDADAPDESQAKEPPCGAEPLSPGFGREPDADVPAQAKTKELPHGVEPPSQRQRMREGLDPAKRTQRPVSGVNARREDGSRQVGECAAAPAVGETEGWFNELAKKVGSMSRRSGPAFDSWSIHLPMDPEVLPDTELRIRASREWMALRFSTQSPMSVRLISEHTPVLQRSLEAILDMKGQIDIDLE